MTRLSTRIRQWVFFREAEEVNSFFESFSDLLQNTARFPPAGSLWGEPAFRMIEVFRGEPYSLNGIQGDAVTCKCNSCVRRRRSRGCPTRHTVRGGAKIPGAGAGSGRRPKCYEIGVW